MKKKILSMILSLCMVVSLLPTIGVTASAISTSLSTVTMGQVYNPSTNPIAISSADDLAYLAQQVNLGAAQTVSYTDSSGPHTVTASTASYKLTVDIDLNDGITISADGIYSGGIPTAWTAIGNNSSAFSGTFDGDGHIVSGIYIKKTGTANSDAYQGLFGKVNNGTIKNIRLRNGYIRGSKYIGGIAGFVSGTSTISNCYNSCGVDAGGEKHGGTYTGLQINAGGMVGYVDSATISNCGNSGSIFADNEAGGMVGRLNSGTITDCYNTGSVTVHQDVGGIVGYAENAPTISNCYNTGNIIGSDNGGIVGISFGATITSCYNIGNLSTSFRIGGVLGSNMGTTTVKYCYNTGSISGSLIAGGSGGVVGYNTTGTCTVENCYNAGSITTSSSGSGTIGGVVGGKAGGATVNAVSCYYDKQMCPAGGIAGTDVAGQADAKLTAEMTGTGVFNDTSYWVTTTDIYPRLTGMDATDAAYVSTAPVFLHDNSAMTESDFDILTAVSTNFMLGGAADSVSWVSGSPSVISISGYNASVAGAGSAIFTASKNGVSRAITLKVASYTATVTVKKDDIPWNSSTPAIQLSTVSAALTNGVSGTLLNNVYTFTGLNPTATYYVWNAISNEYVNQTVSKTSPDTTVNYYTVTLTKGTGIDSISGTGIDSAGSGTFLSGSNVSTWVTLSPGYTWSKWSQTTGGADVSTTQNYMIPTISSAITYTANAVLNGPAPGIVTTSLPNATIGTPYSQSLNAMSLAPLTLTWSITSGALPAGLTLNGSTGVISGTPSTTGTGSFTVTATDSKGSTSRALMITVDNLYPLTVNLDSGSGSTMSGSYASGATVSINAGTRSGYTFNGWTSSNGGSFANASSESTTFTMPGNATTITANWTQISGGGGSGSGSGNGSSSTSSANKNTIVIVDHKDYSIGTENKNGSSTTATVDQGKLTDEISKASRGSSTIFPITTNTNVTAQLVVKNVEDMAKKDMTLTVRTGNVSYNINTSAIDTSKITSSLGNADSKSIPFHVSVANSNAVVKGATVVLSPVEFTITATYNGKTASVDTFRCFVDRTIEITADQAKKITTAVVLGSDGSLRHVPTKVTVIDGRYYAVINSLTNSTYAVVWHPVEFSDTTTSWAKDSINNMGSRMIVTGVGNGKYEPSRDITRAEFAAIIVRSLGLDAGMGDSKFTDVSSSAWYYGYIQTSVGYGIITGYGDGTFGPNDTITREQAMTMIARAMKITKLAPALTEAQISSLLSKYTDASGVSEYAKGNIAACIDTGVILGRPNNTVASKDFITRAEVAVIIERMLQKSNLI